MLDFDGILLTTLQNTFSRPVVVRPIVSQPGAPSYNARGVYSTAPVDILAEVNAVISDQRTSLWIRMSEYPTLPMRNDQIEIPAYLTAPAAGRFEVVDVDSHADGKAILILKKFFAQ